MYADLPARDDSDPIVWRVHIAAPRKDVYDFLASAEGRARFWAESAEEADGVIRFVFPDGTRYHSRILRREPPDVFAVEYFGSTATFRLEATAGGTDVVVENAGVPAADRTEVVAGWVSVLMQLKAAVQFGADLRNHDPARSWSAGYVEN